MAGLAILITALKPLKELPKLGWRYNPLKHRRAQSFSKLEPLVPVIEVEKRVVPRGIL